MNIIEIAEIKDHLPLIPFLAGVLASIITFCVFVFALLSLNKDKEELKLRLCFGLSNATGAFLTLCGIWCFVSSIMSSRWHPPITPVNTVLYETIMMIWSTITFLGVILFSIIALSTAIWLRLMILKFRLKENENIS